MKEKKEWRKPALIVLVRRKPEEAVLEACKVGTRTSPVSGFAM
jgi:hypothetical protein